MLMVLPITLPQYVSVFNEWAPLLDEMEHVAHQVGLLGQAPLRGPWSAERETGRILHSSLHCGRACPLCPDARAHSLR
jgi:hypothetical protein